MPSCMAIAAVFLSLGVPYLDEKFPPEAIPSFPWLSDLGPVGALTLLSTIAGSMITIAGVVFSITIVALTLASAQFGPRLLGNFMRDRGNQVVLGTFVATFLYCLLVLRTIRVNSPGEYTPYWGSLVGLVLAICSLGVLIYFMHHIAVSIQAPNLITVVYGELEHAMARLFPEPIGQEHPDEGNRRDVSRVMTRMEREEDRQAIRVHVDMLQRGGRESVKEMNDLENIEKRCRQVVAILSREEQKRRVSQERSVSYRTEIL